MLATRGQNGRKCQHQEAAAPAAHELRDHAQLVVREKRRLDAAEHESVVAEQFLASIREARGEVVLWLGVAATGSSGQRCLG